ncbi:MAG: hypothetical protein CYPHOPRED_003221 [Cyphobasidiales sp. Tagirdzhanova-0007]|nr:MAG: hypothetical protein CYPHOPRED_003221 [Cyphobasidiales sp. Tagirdzhanova-0007]
MFSGEYAEGNANPTASDCDMDIHSDQSGPGFDDSILDVDDSDIEQEEKGTPSKDPLLDVNIKTTGASQSPWPSIPPVSPKSIYRLADKYNEAELKKKAYANIAASLTPANVLVELAHPFAGIFPEIKDLITTYAVQHWIAVSISQTFEDAVIKLTKIEHTKRAWIDSDTSLDMPADGALAIGALQIPYSAISLVTLTVQNSALTILLHYSRTAPNAKPYSAAAAVLLNEILKGSISFAIALDNAELSPANSAVHHKYPSDTASPLLSLDKPTSVSRRAHSLALGHEESWQSGRTGTALAVLPTRTSWWIVPSQWNFRIRKIGQAVLSRDCWKLAVPACCYVLQNNVRSLEMLKRNYLNFRFTIKLQFVAAANLDVATFQVSYQMKRDNAKQAPVKVETRASSSNGHAEMDPFTGFAAVIMACLTSGFAGVYFEKVLKGSSANLWVRNVQLTLFSLPPAFLAALFPEFSLRDLSGTAPLRTTQTAGSDAPTWLFGNFGGWAIATVLCQVFGGLVTALVIKYSDNIAKGFATSLSIIISFAAGVILFQFPVTLPFLVGCSIVLASTYYYNQPEGETPPKPRMSTNSYQPTSTGLKTNDLKGAFAVEFEAADPLSLSSGPHRRHLSVDQGGTDPSYPFAEYSNKVGEAPRFINLAPFASAGVAVPLEADVSPRSPVPPFVAGQPFGPQYPNSPKI